MTAQIPLWDFCFYRKPLESEFEELPRVPLRDWQKHDET
jgi:hypothetical protein